MKKLLLTCSVLLATLCVSCSKGSDNETESTPPQIEYDHYAFYVTLDKPLSGKIVLSCQNPAFSYAISSTEDKKTDTLKCRLPKSEDLFKPEVTVTLYDPSNTIVGIQTKTLELQPNHAKSLTVLGSNTPWTYRYTIEDGELGGTLTQEYDADCYKCHEFVDLGITDSVGRPVYFSTCNLGANNPEDFGNYYAWGETQPKNNYAKDFSTYFDTGDGVNFKKYNTKDGLKQLEPTDDAATVAWGGNWRMPTEAELFQLKDSCTWTWTTINGSNGYMVTSSNGNSIFMPATGFRYDTGIAKRNIKGVYWSSTLHIYSKHAKRLWLMKEIENPTYEPTPIGIAQDSRFYGECIRPVYTSLTE